MRPLFEKTGNRREKNHLFLKRRAIAKRKSQASGLAYLFYGKF